ncbi:MAG TPA: hypothetical protein VNK95_15245 [Caldilineaceae bacterium]|nr:hypothetical protein [Caldilineaceae bacterium]
MRQISHTRLIALGFILLLLGFLSIFGMVIRLLEPSLALSFLAYASSSAGLLLGLAGLALYSHKGSD